MATTEKKTEQSELNLLGLFSLKTKVQKMTFKQLMLFISIILVFVLIALMILGPFALPTMGIPAILSQIPKLAVGKIFKSRSP